MYIALLCSQLKQGSLPTDTLELAEIAGVTVKRFEKLWPKRLARKFVQLNDRWYNFAGVRTKRDALTRAMRRPAN